MHCSSVRGGVIVHGIEDDVFDDPEPEQIAELSRIILEAQEVGIDTRYLLTEAARDYPYRKHAVAGSATVTKSDYLIERTKSAIRAIRRERP